jgi:hypothetical protein
MTQFRGHKTGFNRTGSNSCVPMEDGMSTKFTGRGALPKGKMKVPGGLNDIEGGNRRLAKTRVGDGGGSGSSFRGTNAFSKGGGKRK